MATITKPDLLSEPEGDQMVVLPGVGWQGYTTLLKLRGERRSPKLVYLDGSLTLVSPSYLHDHLSRRLGLIVFVLAEELDIHCTTAGSTTYRRRPKEGGVEADVSFYFANRHRVRGKRQISLRTDPPPDLVIEVVVSRDADEALEVYRRFGVPEVWVCDAHRLAILRLGPDGTYVESERSLAFPMLAAAEIHPWAMRDEDDSDLVWLKALRRWVAEVLVPRHHEHPLPSGPEAERNSDQKPEPMT